MSLRYEFVSAYDASRLNHVGTYKRTVPVSLDRMYENALDWEHLPHLHASSFGQLRHLDSGAWGWRCAVDDAKGRTSELELRLDRSARRWITRNIAGPSEGAEIWTHVFETGPRELDLVIDFFVPGVVPEARDKVGLAYARAYETLYDEDVWMMTERQRALDLRVDSVDRQEQVTVPLPNEDDLPLALTLSGRGFQVDRLADGWVVYPALCPHQAGPLNGRIDKAGQIHCPWHGYAFDVRSGACVTGSSCRFGERPVVCEQQQDGVQCLVFSWSQA